MEYVFDFLRAALPWITIGLLLAAFFVRSAGRKKKEEQTGDFGTEGMCLDTAFGSSQKAQDKDNEK